MACRVHGADGGPRGTLDCGGPPDYGDTLTVGTPWTMGSPDCGDTLNCGDAPGLWGPPALWGPPDCGVPLTVRMPSTVRTPSTVVMPCDHWKITAPQGTPGLPSREEAGLGPGLSPSSSRKGAPAVQDAPPGVSHAARSLHPRRAPHPPSASLYSSARPQACPRGDLTPSGRGGWVTRTTSPQ